jgi:hypothetical protein
MEVLSTSDPDKLPPEVRELEDPAKPLPAGVQFFEERFSYLGLLKQFLLGVGVAVAGIVLMLACVLAFISDLHATPPYSSTSFEWKVGLGVGGAIFVYLGYWLVTSTWPNYRLLRQQRRGLHPRYGIFLTGDLLVRHSWFDTTIIPRPLFKGITGGAVHYEEKGETKSFTLPEIVDNGNAALAAAIETWDAKASPGGSHPNGYGPGP